MYGIWRIRRSPLHSAPRVPKDFRIGVAQPRQEKPTAASRKRSMSGTRGQSPYPRCIRRAKGWSGADGAGRGPTPPRQNLAGSRLGPDAKTGAAKHRLSPWKVTGALLAQSNPVLCQHARGVAGARARNRASGAHSIGGRTLRAITRPSEIVAVRRSSTDPPAGSGEGLSGAEAPLREGNRSRCRFRPAPEAM